MNGLSNRLKKMSTSQTIAMSEKAREMKQEGKQVINLSVGEPDFDTPDFIKNSAKEALDKGWTSYSPVPGYLDLRETICKKFKRDNRLDYQPNQIVVSTGAKQSTMNVCLSLLNHGDEAIIPAPYWVSYFEMVKLSEATPVVVPCALENDFKITPKQLEDAISDKTKLFIFSSPCNPSGSVYSREDLKGLVDVFKKHPSVYILSDEIYEHINYQGNHASIAEFEEVYDRVITVNGLSKAFAMTGWRIGYIGAAQWIANACQKLQGQFTSGTNSIAQRAAIMALSADYSQLSYLIEAFTKRRKLVLDLISEIPEFDVVEPKGAFYVFPDVSHYFNKIIGSTTIKDATDFSLFLLEKTGVATVTGIAFGAPNCIRISYATSEENLVEAFSRIKKLLG